MNNDILITGANGFIGTNLLGGKRYSGDVYDVKALDREAVGCSGIVHLAAKSDKRIFDNDPKRGIESNLIGLCNVLEIALLNGSWVIFVSTYQVKERHLYGLSKLMGEELCRHYQKKGVRIKILRLPIVYGVGAKQGKIVQKFINLMKNGEEPEIDTDDKFFFGYVKDVAKTIEAEVSVLCESGMGSQFTLTELRDGIRECLNG